MNQSDPGSLDHMHDIVTAVPAPLWPPAPGWYVVLALLALGLFAMLYWSWRHWLANAYRREALARCDAIMHNASPATRVAELAEILKRTALTAYPRETVASLTGDDWILFLDQHARSSDFGQSATAHELFNATYDKPTGSPSTDAQQAYDLVCRWIRRHVADQSLPT